jgi:hypothetical protein
MSAAAHADLAYLQEEEEEEPQEAPAAAASKRSAAAASTSGDEAAPSTSEAAAAKAAAPAADEAAAAAAAGPAAKRPKFSKLGKDPGVQTAFLPDKDRERQEEELKRRLRDVRGAVNWHRGCGGAVCAGPQLQQQLARCLVLILLIPCARGDADVIIIADVVAVPVQGNYQGN